MYSKNKSKVLQTLEESVPPLNHEEAIEMIAQMVRQPESNPIEVGLRLGKIDKDHSIMHMESQMKLHAAMEHFDATPEQLDSVFPVNDKELSELVETSTSLMDDDDDDDAEYEDDDDEEDEDDEDAIDDDVDDNDDKVGGINEGDDDTLERYNVNHKTH
ncbi:eisosome protein SEG2 [Drosophila innubila]|uniref:eisosome protein SEG2 n=1 Tax=Drosophila innubila TaxID=198719 RepID=UPI00148BD417|nr:eisosome protein SEG2 [Drosophila innubila]